MSSRSDLIRDTVSFVLSHYECKKDGSSPFTIEPVNPDTWWSDVQLLLHDPEMLLPESRAHFQARLNRWQDLAVEHLLKDDPK